MPRHPTRPRVILTLVLLALILLAPTHAKALPQGHTIHLAAEHPQAAPGLFAQLWSYLAALWGQNGSGLEPNGASASSGSDVDGPGENGSGLDPNGRP